MNEIDYLVAVSPAVVLGFAVFALSRACDALQRRVAALEAKPDPTEAAVKVLNFHQIRETARRQQAAQ